MTRERAATVEVSNRLYDGGRRTWEDLAAKARAADTTLYAIVYSRLLELRQECERAAFELQISVYDAVKRLQESRKKKEEGEGRSWTER